MAKVQETEDGYYEQHGDVLEWRWKGQPSIEAPAPVTTESVAPVVKPKRKSVRKAKR